MRYFSWIFSLLLSTTTLLTVPATGVGLEAIASIQHVSGTARVERANSMISIRKGLILRDNDVVVTGPEANLSIVFRDGTMIRLYPNTRFLIERSIETQSGSRQFIHNFFLKLGTFWGHFSQKGIETVIRTPTATCGIKGTTVAFSQRADGLTVALSAGSVTIQNDVETVEMTPGHSVIGITRNTSIRDRIQPFRYRLSIRPDQVRVTPPSAEKPTEIYFSLQLVDYRTGQNVFKSGALYINHRIDALEFDPDIRLNERGYARIRARWWPMTVSAATIERIEILAMMEGEDLLDVESGRTALTVNPPETVPQKRQIDAGSGRIR
jgi:hypothetical protein